MLVIPPAIDGDRRIGMGIASEVRLQRRVIHSQTARPMRATTATTMTH
jgi:hypothetical protein